MILKIDIIGQKYNFLGSKSVNSSNLYDGLAFIYRHYILSILILFCQRVDVPRERTFYFSPSNLKTKILRYCTYVRKFGRAYACVCTCVRACVRSCIRTRAHAYARENVRMHLRAHVVCMCIRMRTHPVLSLWACKNAFALAIKLKDAFYFAWNNRTSKTHLILR